MRIKDKKKNKREEVGRWKTVLAVDTASCLYESSLLKVMRLVVIFLFLFMVSILYILNYAVSKFLCHCNHMNIRFGCHLPCNWILEIMFTVILILIY